MFDRLQTASFLGGYNASISGNMPAMSHYVTTGMDPFVAVYSAVEVGMFFFYVQLKADYTVRLCRMRQAYNRPTTRIVSCKWNLQLTYDCRVHHKKCCTTMVGIGNVE